MSSRPCNTELVTVDRQKNTTERAPIWSISAAVVLSWVKYNIFRIGFASVIKPTAHGIAITILKRLTVLILLCTCFLLPVCTVATRLGTRDAASALEMESGTLIIVLYCPWKIPKRLAYSFLLNPCAAITLLKSAVSTKSLILYTVALKITGAIVTNRTLYTVL